MGYGPAAPPLMPKNKHRWRPIINTSRPAREREIGDRCEDCGIVRTARGWRRGDGDHRSGPVPRCGERWP